MFARTIRLQKRAHTESSERGKSSLQPRSADPSLREERERGGDNNTAPDIVPSCRSAASDNLPPTAARFVAEARFALESGSVTSRSVGSRCCQVALLFGQSRGGGRSVQRRWWWWCWRGSRFCACRSVRGSRSQVERRASAGDAGSSQSGDRSPKMAHRCGATRLGRTRGENSLSAVRVWPWCVNL